MPLAELAVAVGATLESFWALRWANGAYDIDPTRPTRRTWREQLARLWTALTVEADLLRIQQDTISILQRNVDAARENRAKAEQLAADLAKLAEARQAWINDLAGALDEVRQILFIRTGADDELVNEVVATANHVLAQVPGFDPWTRTSGDPTRQ